MKAKLELTPEARAALLTALPSATWEYDEDTDEMEIRLPGVAGKTGYYALLGDDLYVRLDEVTGQPLGVMIPTYHYWLTVRLAEASGKRHAVPARRDPARWMAEQRNVVPDALARELSAAS
jgi:hypothetical protein